MEKTSTGYKIFRFILLILIIAYFLLLLADIDFAGAAEQHTTSTALSARLSLPLVLGADYPAPPGRELPTPAPTACGPEPKSCPPTPTPVTIIIGSEP